MIETVHVKPYLIRHDLISTLCTVPTSLPYCLFLPRLFLSPVLSLLYLLCLAGVAELDWLVQCSQTPFCPMIISIFAVTWVFPY